MVEYTNNCIYLPATKRFLNPLDMGEEDFDMRDVLAGLGNICRYGGNVSMFYSVAQHCVELAQFFLKQEKPELARYALVHDAIEVYFLDLPRPLKIQIPQFLEIENLLEGIVQRHFGFTDECVEEFDEFDLRICINEMDVLMPGVEDPGLSHLEPLPFQIDKGMSPAMAVYHYKRFFEFLFPEYTLNQG